MKSVIVIPDILLVITEQTAVFRNCSLDQNNHIRLFRFATLMTWTVVARPAVSAR